MCTPGKCSTSDLHSQFLVLWNTISLASPGWPWTWGLPSSVPPITKGLGHRCMSSCLAFFGISLCGLKTLRCPSNKWYVVHLNLPPAYEMNVFSDICKWFCFNWTGIAQGGQGGQEFWSCRRWIVAIEAMMAAETRMQLNLTSHLLVSWDSASLVVKLIIPKVQRRNVIEPCSRREPNSLQSQIFQVN